MAPGSQGSSLGSQTRKAIDGVDGAATVTQLPPTEDGDVLVAAVYSETSPRSADTPRT